MPKFRITDSETGDVLTITADREPTQDDVAEIFASRPKEEPKAEPKAEPAKETVKAKSTVPPDWIESTVTTATGVPMTIRLPRDPFQSIVELPTATVPESVKGEITLASPIGVPMTVSKPAMAKVGAAEYNALVKPAIEMPFSPVGVAAMAAPQTALGRAAVQGTFAGMAAKAGGEALGEASVTGDEQKALEGALMLGAAPVLAKPTLRPAVRTMEGEVIAGKAGQTHNEIIKENELKPTEIDRREFVDQKGNEVSREQAAAVTGLPTETEPGKLHSTDLPEAKVEAAEGETAKPAAEAVKPKSFEEEMLAREKREAIQAQETFDKSPYRPAIKLEDGQVVVSTKPNEGHGELSALYPDKKKTAGFVKRSTGEFMTSLEVARDRMGEGKPSAEVAPQPVAEPSQGTPPAAEPTPQTPLAEAQTQGSSTTPGLAISEAKPEAQKMQSGVKTPAAEAGAGPGSPHVSEVPEATGGEDVYGIAQRVREKRAAAGTVEPVEPGKGTTPLAEIDRGRQLLKQGADPEEVLSRFEQTKRFSTDDINIVRAHGENLAWAARRVEEKYGTESPEYAEARKALSEWDKRSKAIQTEWHKQGMAQQGETDIDTGSFTGLERAYEKDTGKTFNPRQKADAKKIAKANADAQQAHLQAEEMMAKEITSRPDLTKAERNALMAAWQTVRDNAARIAKLETKQRVAEAKRQAEIARIEQAAKDRAARATTDVARENAVRSAQAVREAAVAKANAARARDAVRLKAEQKALEAAQKTVRDAAARLAEKERKELADPALRVWNKANTYIEQAAQQNAHISFDDIRNKVATDLGMSVDKVTRLMAQDKRAKYLADDLWRKQQESRRLKAQAKAWLQKQDVPAYERFLGSLPRALFSIRVGFHGTVALGTHAPQVAFQPRFWRIYANNFLNMYKMAFGPTIYEREISDLVRRPNWTTARRAGLINDPYMYEEYHVSPITGSRIAGMAPQVVEWANRITTMGNRGYAVLKVLRQDMFDQMWANLPKRLQIPEVAKAFADVVNHNTGVVQAKFHPATAVALFAPKLEASRIMWLAGDPIRMGKTFANWKNVSLGDQQFALAELKSKAWVFGTMASALAINQGILKATGSNQDVNITDPFRSDFLKFKIAGMQVSYGNPLITLARLPVRLFVNIKNEGKFSKLIYEDENVYTTFGEYARTQASPFMALVTDTAIGRDWQRRPLPRAGFGLLPGKTNIPQRLKAQGVQPYTWGEFWTQQGLPIPAQEAVREVWGKGLGMSEKDMEQWIKAWAIVTFMSGTGGRMAEDWNVQRRNIPAAY